MRYPLVNRLNGLSEKEIVRFSLGSSGSYFSTAMRLSEISAVALIFAGSLGSMPCGSSNCIASNPFMILDSVGVKALRVTTVRPKS